MPNTITIELTPAELAELWRIVAFAKPLRGADVHVHLSVYDKVRSAEFLSRIEDATE